MSLLVNQCTHQNQIIKKLKIGNVCPKCEHFFITANTPRTAIPIPALSRAKTRKRRKRRRSSKTNIVHPKSPFTHKKHSESSDNNSNSPLTDKMSLPNYENDESNKFFAIAEILSDHEFENNAESLSVKPYSKGEMDIERKRKMSLTNYVVTAVQKHSKTIAVVEEEENVVDNIFTIYENNEFKPNVEYVQYGPNDAIKKMNKNCNKSDKFYCIENGIKPGIYNVNTNTEIIKDDKESMGVNDSNVTSPKRFSNFKDSKSTDKTNHKYELLFRQRSFNPKRSFLLYST